MARPLLIFGPPPAGAVSLPNRAPAPRSSSENPMARSLNVSHQEKMATSPLFNAFLLLAFGWMIAGAVLANLADAAEIGGAVVEG